MTAVNIPWVSPISPSAMRAHAQLAPYQPQPQSQSQSHGSHSHLHDIVPRHAQSQTVSHCGGPSGQPSPKQPSPNQPPKAVHQQVPAQVCTPFHPTPRSQTTASAWAPSSTSPSPSPSPATGANRAYGGWRPGWRPRASAYAAVRGVQDGDGQNGVIASQEVEGGVGGPSSPTFPAGGGRDVTVSTPDSESSLTADSAANSAAITALVRDASNAPLVPGPPNLKRERPSSPFEWAADPDEDPCRVPIVASLPLADARVAPIVDKVDNQQIHVLPLPLPSKRAKLTRGSRAVLVPAEQLPVFPLPPLPPIMDETLKKQVFTHISLFEAERGLFEHPPDKPAGHYEKLEHVGDSILGMVVTTWLHELKPGLTCGTASKLKAHLVSNATLSHISGMYNLPAKLDGDKRLLPLLRAQTDVRAAMVEAYIAGVFFSFPPSTRNSDGLACVTSWLREMFDPLYDFFLDYMRSEYVQHHSAMGPGVDGVLELAKSPEELERLDAKAEGMGLLLSMYGKQRQRAVEFEAERYSTSVGFLWRIKACVDGITLGEATRADRARAKNAAAWQAAKKLGIATEFDY